MRTPDRLALATALAAALGTAHAADPTQISTQAGCAVCHAADKKLIGPSWKEVAAKYKGNAGAMAQLTERVRKGSTGVWGKLPMAPVDAAKISDADLKTVLSWVLKTPS
jgi:cytochrome c